MAWGEKKAVEDLNNRVCGASYNDFSGAENTELILASLTGTTSAPAAEAAKSYKAYTLANDGIEDTSDWHLPGLGVLHVIYKCKAEIQEALEYFWYSDCKLNETSSQYWSSTVNAATEAFAMSIHTGIWQNKGKTDKLLVRAVCEEV